MSDKVKFIKDGKVRNISKRELNTWNPEEHGWARVEPSNEAKAAQEKAAKEAEEKAAAEKKAAEDAAAKAKAEAETTGSISAAATSEEFSIEGKTSKEFKTDKIEAIKAALTGKSVEQIEAFFTGEDRQSMTIAKLELIEKASA